MGGGNETRMAADAASVNERVTAVGHGLIPAGTLGRWHGTCCLRVVQPEGLRCGAFTHQFLSEG